MADKVPRLMPGVDIKKLKLDATDGFLLTRIDGKLGAKDLSRDTGLPDFTVTRAIEKLEKLAVIEMVEPGAPPRPPPEAEKPAPIAFDVSQLTPNYDPSELEQPADLTHEQKKKILDYFTRLDDLDHYMLLGIEKDADKKTVKRAYMGLAGTFHPDRHFKKDLGVFKAKLTEVFNRITEANDTLVDPVQRAEYDAYLAEVATTRGMEMMLERAMAESAAAAAAQAKAAATAATAATAAAAAAPPPEPVPTGPSVADINARKAALAARLRAGGRPQAAAAKPAAPAVNPLKYENTNDAMDALKRRYHQRVEHATQAHAQRYVQSAEEALAKNNLVSASTSLSIASKFAPEDADLAMRAKELKIRADKTLCESYLKQANYEEKQRQWDQAAKSWLKVAKIRPDAESHERSANAILRSEDPDLREAAEHAKKALTFEPRNIANHITLVEIYIAAGLTTSAKRAAETVHQIDPGDDRVIALIKRMTDSANKPAAPKPGPAN